MHTHKCAALHFAPWCVRSFWLQQMVEAVRSGIVPADAERAKRAYTVDGDPCHPYQVTADGIAIISLEGALMKQWSKYGGTSTTWARAAIRHADKNDEVGGTMLHIDSPGGTSAGMAELSDDVRDTKKPIHAHIDDLGASAAYGPASQADHISMNRTGFAGAIGTYAVIHDTSGAMEMKGVKVHVLATGFMKGAGVEGTEITKEQLDIWQGQVEQHFSHFAALVRNGRSQLRAKAMFNKVSDGRVFDSKQSMELGLIDRIESFDTAMIRLKQAI